MQYGSRRGDKLLANTHGKRDVREMAAVEVSQLSPSDAEFDEAGAVLHDRHIGPARDLFRDAFSDGQCARNIPRTRRRTPLLEPARSRIDGRTPRAGGNSLLDIHRATGCCRWRFRCEHCDFLKEMAPQLGSNQQPSGYADNRLRGRLPLAPLPLLPRPSLSISYDPRVARLPRRTDRCRTRVRPALQVNSVPPHAAFEGGR
jgi:hypothetical protein